MLGRTGLYIGCGNGRNYLPLVAGGLDMLGLDVSAVALEQLRDTAPERASRLVCGDLRALPHAVAFDLVIGIQVFQHGNREAAHEHVAAAQARLSQGGLFCIRVNHAQSDLVLPHRVIERDDDGSYSVEYLAGPKSGLLVHFFTEVEIAGLFAGYRSVLPLRRAVVQRADGRTQWSQCEAIWQKAP